MIPFSQDHFSVFVAHSSSKALKKIPNPWKNRIVACLTRLETMPFEGEKMLGKLADKRKIRVWPYRVLYTVDEDK